MSVPIAPPLVSVQKRSLLSRMGDHTGTLVMAMLIFIFGAWVFYPLALIVLQSFNSAPFGQAAQWTLANWQMAFSDPRIIGALGNSIWVFTLYMAIGYPTSVLIAWTLARTNIPYSRNLEFGFWISFMMPTLSVTIGWTFLLDDTVGMLNIALMRWVPFINEPIFNIYSLSGIIFAHLMANAISQSVMLLTPAFRNMDVTFEEAGRISGASKMGTAFRITLPLMTPPMVLVFMLMLVRMFQSFDIEQILGKPFGFFIYSTRIFDFIRFFEPPAYGAASALGIMTMAVLLIVIPVQRWLTGGRRFTTITGQYKYGLIDLGKARPFVFTGVVILLAMLTVIPVLTLLGGSFMTRVGFFDATPMFTLHHWAIILVDPGFLRALQTTLILASATGILSPIIFSLVAYVLVRTNWPGKGILDSIFWVSSAIPGMVAGLALVALFLNTPFLTMIYGTIYALMLVVVLQGKLLSTQMTKGVMLQLGADMEESARVCGAGWVRTYLKIWLPLLLPIMIMIGIFNFVLAANTTSSIILLATQETLTLSILALEFMTDEQGAKLEEAGIISLFIVLISVALALVARRVSSKFGLQRLEGGSS
jgi:iron(III) transport system permease protein